MHVFARSFRSSAVRADGRAVRRSFVCAAWCVAACAAAFAAPASAQYDDEDGGGYAVVIQDKKFKMAHEFTLQTGILPIDAFYKGVPATGRYTLHFDDFNGWEIAGTYSANIDSGLRGILADDPFNVQPQNINELFVIVETNYVMKPFQGKLALFNSTIIYAQLFAVAGLTVSYWSDTSFRPGPDVGLGMHLYIFDWLMARVDLRHALVMNGVPIVDENASVDGILQMYAGVSFNLGGG
jgi:outer membrane beta-barrel protein